MPLTEDAARPENPTHTSFVPEANSKAKLRDIKNKSVRGGAVTLFSQGVSTFVHLISTILLARMLTPADFGTIAMVTAITAFAGLFRDLGLSSAAIQKQDLTNAQQSNLFWINVAAGAILSTLVFCISPFVAWFYQQAHLASVTAVLSLTFIVGSFGTQHSASLVREMCFGRKAAAEITGSVIALCVAITLAYHNFGYWALVSSVLVGAACTTLLLTVLSPFWPAFPRSSEGMRHMLSFGAHVTAFNLINYFHRSFDNLLIGRVWGPTSLGLYSRAYALLMAPLAAIRGPITAVAFPAMSRLRDDDRAFRNYGRRLIELLALASMPLVAFIAISSHSLITVVLGEHWLEMHPIFIGLAPAAFIQTSCGIRGIVLHATGNGRRLLHWGIINSVVVSLSFVMGLSWGAVGVAVAYSIANYLLLMPSIAFVFHGTPLRSSDFYLGLAMPAACSAGAACFTLSIDRLVGTTTPTIAIALQLLCFMSSFIVLLLLTARGRATARYVQQLILSQFAKSDMRSE